MVAHFAPTPNNFYLVSCAIACYKNNMEHTLKLQPKYFDFIHHGTKRIELRLNDEKRQQIKIGDTIKFVKEPALQETFTVAVVGLLRYQSFADLLADFDIDILADQSITKAALLTDLAAFYTPEKQAQYGVLGIRVSACLT